MPGLADLINKQKNDRVECKIQLNMGVNFISTNDTGEICTFYVRSDNEEIRSGNQTLDIITKFIKSIINYQEEEKILRSGSNFVFESVDLLAVNMHKTNLKRGKSYIKSPEWILNKRATMNPKNNDNKCFQYSITVALNHQKIENHPERMSNIKPFIDKYNWKGIDFLARINDWKKFEENKKDVSINILYVPTNTKTINLAYKSEYNLTHENKVVLLMTTNDKQSDKIDKWHYIALKSVNTDNGFNRPIRSLSRLFRGITSNNNGDFYCLGCLHSFRTDNALKKHERLCNNHDYCHIEMPTRDNNTLKYNHGEKSLKVPWVIYADFECLLIKQQLCQNNPEESYTEKKSIHESCGYSIDLVSSFDSKQDKHSFYKGRDCSKNFCEDLKKHAIKIMLKKKI